MVLTYMVYSGDPTNDPEVASSCIDLAEKLLPRYLNTFFNPQVQESIPILLNFAIQSLIATEVLPKRSAATFWVSPFNLLACFLTRPSPHLFKQRINHPRFRICWMAQFKSMAHCSAVH